MSTTDLKSGTPSTRSWLLIGSLALNLLVIGSIAGVALARGWHGGPRRMFGPHDQLNLGHIIGDQGLRGFVRSLPAERRNALRAATEQGRQTIKPLRTAADQSRSEVQAAMAAEPFDGGRLDKAMSDAFSAELAVKRAGVAILTTAMGQMTASERSQFQLWRKAHRNDPPPPPPQPVAPKQP